MVLDPMKINLVSKRYVFTCQLWIVIKVEWDPFGIVLRCVINFLHSYFNPNQPCMLTIDLSFRGAPTHLDQAINCDIKKTEPKSTPKSVQIGTFPVQTKRGTKNGHSFGFCIHKWVILSALKISLSSISTWSRLNSSRQI